MNPKGNQLRRYFNALALFQKQYEKISTTYYKTEKKKYKKYNIATLIIVYNKNYFMSNFLLMRSMVNYKTFLNEFHKAIR